MKCPKCGYLGFEDVQRCRNCGYDFSLAPGPNLPELPMRDQDAHENPIDDLALIDAAALLARHPAGVPLTAGLGNATSARGSSSAGELPLFGDPIFDDEPLIKKAPPPRPPLAVRRATPEVPRLRSQLRMPMLDLGQDPDSGPAQAAAARAHASEWPAQRGPRVEPAPAALGARGVAVAIDLLILAAIDAVVIYFTLQICGLDAADFSILPKGPLLAFLLVQNGGYLVAFTVGGQTLGKMAVGIKIVPTRLETSLDLGHAIIRTLVWVALAVPAGLGFLTALAGHEHRGLHDRCAGTRVVRASV